MRGFRSRRSHGSAWTIAVGATAGVAAAALWMVRPRGWRVRQEQRPREISDLEERVVDALLDDDMTSRCALEVAAVGEGVIELTGTVGTATELRRAVEVTQGVEGVRTVVNRVEVGLERSRMSERQRRYQSGDPALSEPHWYGVGVGTGRRRQGASTDPAQRDDRVEMVTEQFEAERDERPEDPDFATGGTRAGEAPGI